MERDKSGVTDPKKLAVLNAVREETRKDLPSVYGFINSYFHIKNIYTGDLEVIQPTESQQVRRSVMHYLRNKYGMIQLIDLKSRQVGFTTDTALIHGAETYLSDNSICQIMAQEDDTLNQILLMHKLWYDELPPDMKLPLDKCNDRGMSWLKSRSQILLANPKTKVSGRGKSISRMHYSEAAFYQNLKLTMATWQAAISKREDRVVILDTTANGTDNYYYELWSESWRTMGKNARQPSDTGFYPLFSMWFKDSKLRRPFKDALDQSSWVNEVLKEDKWLFERYLKYKLDLEQIYWYWWQLTFEYKGNKLIMCQEYPCEPMEAFIASGTPIFPLELVQTYKEMTRRGTRYNPLICPNFTDLKQLGEGRHLEPNKHTYLEIWHEPYPGHRYIVVGDVAEGIEGTGDYSTWQVWDVDTFSMVAELHGWIRATPFADMGISLAQMYNRAWLAPENRQYGEAVIDRIKQKRYFKLWRARKPKGNSWEVTNRVGFTTDETMRPIMINRAVEYFIARQLDPEFIPSEAVLSEIMTFTMKGAKMRAEADSKTTKDDRVITLCMGVQCVLQFLGHGALGSLIALVERKQMRLLDESQRHRKPREQMHLLLANMGLAKGEYGEEGKRILRGR